MFNNRNFFATILLFAFLAINHTTFAATTATQLFDLPFESLQRMAIVGDDEKLYIGDYIITQSDYDWLNSR